jgi:hypothetical protein
MGRFDLKYPREAIAELYRLTLDAEPQLSVPRALDEIVRTHGVAIVASTAYSYIQREKVRRSGEGSPLPDDVHEALDVLSRRITGVLEAEARRIVGAASRGGPLDVDRLRNVARTIKELRVGLGPRPRPAETDHGDSEQNGKPRTGKGGGQPSTLERLLAAAEDSDPRLEDGVLEGERDPGGSLSKRHNVAGIDWEARAQVEAYLEQKVQVVEQ